MANDATNQAAKPNDPAGSSVVCGAAPDAIDQHLLEQICIELEPDTLCRFMTEAATDIPKRIIDLELVLARRDHAELERLCHCLRGAAINLGLIGIQDRTHALEMAARCQDEAAERRAYADLRSASESARRAIEEWVSKKTQVRE